MIIMSPSSLYLLIVQLTLRYTTLLSAQSQCTYSNDQSIAIISDKIIGNIEIKEIMEVSFNLTIHSECQAKYCHIFAIDDRFPLILTYNGSLVAASRSNEGVISSYENPTINIPSSILFDGHPHNLYFKFSFTESIIQIDGTSYAQITNGQFNHSNYIGQVTTISTVWVDGQAAAHNGTIDNLCITASNPSDPYCTNGVIGIHEGVYMVCCLSSCGICGGTDCEDRPGGGEGCCRGVIISTGISCDDNVAPCIIESTKSPTTNPSIDPTISPTDDPTSIHPSISPSSLPTNTPSSMPTYNPTSSNPTIC